MAAQGPGESNNAGHKDRRRQGQLDRRSSNPNQQLAGHLELLAVMSRHFAASLDIQATIQHALSLITQYIKAEGGSLFLLNEDESKLTCRACVGPVDITGFELDAGVGIVGRCVQDNRSEMVRDVLTDPNFDHSADQSSGFSTRSILCAPMTIQDSRVGAIELVNKQGGDGLFSEPDLMMLQALSSSAALAILNARMAGELVQQQRVRRELELAAEIQRSLLPQERSEDYPVCGINLPAREVSGDFYDFFDVEDGTICFCLGDVSGKGMNAALLMSKTASLFRCLGKTIQDPGALLSTINAEVCETATHGMFVTMVCGAYDPRSGKVRIANAGHEPPLVHMRDGRFLALPAETPPLGIVPPLPGEDNIATMDIDLSGGTLYIFTDGVTEGELDDGKRLEVEGFKEMIVGYSDAPAIRRIRAVVSRLEDSVDARHDDITILAVDDEGQR